MEPESFDEQLEILEEIRRLEAYKSSLDELEFEDWGFITQEEQDE